MNASLKASLANDLQALDHDSLVLRAVTFAARADEEAARANEEAEKATLFKDLYQQLMERYRELELGRTTQSERIDTSPNQLTLDLLGEMLPAEPAKAELRDVKAHTRTKRGKRKPLPEDLPVVRSLVAPDEVLEEGLEHFDIVGTEMSRTVERQPSRLFVHEIIRPKFLRKDRDRSPEARQERELAGEAGADFIIADPPCHPIPKSMVGVGFLVQTLVMRWEDHLPLHRQESIFKREGFAVHKSTVCGWHTAAAGFVEPLIEAMWADARSSPILYTDATSVRMQATKRCKRIHIWTVIAPERHILFAQTPKHNRAAVDQLLGAFSGYLVADAATVYDHLYYESKVIECNCWAHARRYFHRALESQPDEALQAVKRINQLFHHENQFKELSAEDRLEARRLLSKPVVDEYFEWCGTQKSYEGTPLHAAIAYSINQREGLGRFLSDARIPLHNNLSELSLRRQAIGRKNWLFLGNDRGATNNVRFVSLLASCALHGLNPVDYLRDLFCLLADWPANSLLELAPLNWAATRTRPEVVNMLARNPHWRAATLDVNKQLPELTGEI